MVNRRISKDLKECALSLWDKGWESKEIINALGISLSSLYRWQAIFDECGSPNRIPTTSHGRSRILSRAVLTAVQTLYETDADLYLDKLVLWLTIKHDIVISRASLQRNLCREGLTQKLLHKIAIERDEEL